MSLYLGYIGDYAPRYVYMRRSGEGLDYDAVTVAKFYVRKPDGTEVIWTPTIYAKSTALGYLDMKYTLAASPGTSDFDQAGEYQIYSVLTTAAGPVRGDTLRFRVRAKYEAP